MADRKQHRIAALERMGYTCEFRSYWDGESDGYAIYDPDGEPCPELSNTHSYTFEAWDEFLKFIGKLPD